MGGEGPSGLCFVEGILKHYHLTLHPWDGAHPSVSLVGSRPFSYYLIQLRDQKRQQQLVQALSIEGAGSKVPSCEGTGKWSLTLKYPFHLLASVIFFFFF